MTWRRLTLCMAALLALAIMVPDLAAASSEFVPIAPCRVVDTRCYPAGSGQSTCTNGNGVPGGAGTVMAVNVTRNFDIVGTAFDPVDQGGFATGGCGVPGYTGAVPGAAAVAINITAVSPVGNGNMTAWPTDQTQPSTSNINYRTGVNLANSAIVKLSQDATEGADVSVEAHVSNVHLIIDIVGYFVEQP